MCVFNHQHDGHKVIEIKNIDSLKKENIKLEDELELLNKHTKEIEKLKNNIEAEIKKINDLYEKAMENLENSYQKKIEIILKEKEEHIEKINNEVTKVKESLENFLSGINNEILIKERINKGILKMENKEQNIFQIFSYISKINQTKKIMKTYLTKLMRNLNIKYDENSNKIFFDEYYFNGWPIPKNIKIENLTSTSAKISWSIDNINILNQNKNYLYAIEMRKERQNFQYIFENHYSHVKSYTNNPSSSHIVRFGINI